jgi:hypothetical protein
MKYTPDAKRGKEIREDIERRREDGQDSEESELGLAINEHAVANASEALRSLAETIQTDAVDIGTEAVRMAGEFQEKQQEDKDSDG